MAKRELTRREFMRAFLASAAVTGGGMLGGFFYANGIEPAWVDISAVEVALPNLGLAFDGYRLLQISDIHADGVWMDRQRLLDLAALVSAQAPDLVAITGDLATHEATPLAAMMIEAFSLLQARDGVVAVLGNHDHWGKAAVTRQILAASGILELRDGVRTIRRGASALHVAGLDDLWPDMNAFPALDPHQARFQRLLGAIPAGQPAVLLVHEPDFADISAASGRINLQLSGHSHGGQVAVPFQGPPLLPPLGQKYPSGPYQVGGMLQYTNRGLGMIEPYVRFNCRPEITVLTLRAA